MLVHTIYACAGSRAVRSFGLNLGSSWWRAVSFTPRPICPQKKAPRCPLNRGLSGFYGRYGRFGEEKDILLMSGIEALSWRNCENGWNICYGSWFTWVRFYIFFFWKHFIGII